MTMMTRGSVAGAILRNPALGASGMPFFINALETHAIKLSVEIMDESSYTRFMFTLVIEKKKTIKTKKKLKRRGYLLLHMQQSSLYSMADDTKLLFTLTKQPMPQGGVIIDVSQEMDEPRELIFIFIHLFVF
jgi:hypothetical protein